MPNYDPDNPNPQPQAPTKMPGWIKFDSQGNLKHPLRTFIRLMFSDDNAMPSSARVIGTSIFAAVSVGFAAITWVLLWKIVHTQDAPVVESCVSAIKSLMWGYCILVFSALSLYGIHVWKYVAQLQSGFLGSTTNPFGSNYGQQYGYNNMNKSYTPAVSSAVKALDPTPAPGPPAPPPPKTPVAGVGSDD